MIRFGRRKSAVEPPAAPLPPESAAVTMGWLERAFASGDGYRYANDCPTSLLATCMGVLAHELFENFQHLSPERKQSLTRSVLSYQSRETGLFRDPAHDDRVLFQTAKFPPLYIEWQETYFALHALNALGEKPRYPLLFLEPFKDSRVRQAWLRGLGFDDFWFSSNYVMFLLCFLLEAEGTESAAVQEMLDALSARQDPKTGLWGTNQGATLFNGMAGAYHLYGFYQFTGRRIAYQSAALDSTLSLQANSGLFGTPNGGPCEDLDAVDILVKLEPESSEQDLRIRAALERALTGLQRCRLANGGYSWWPSRAAEHQTISYSNLQNLRAKTDAGDIWSAWFRPLTIALARSRLGLPIGWRAQFRRIPLLGWHPEK